MKSKRHPSPASSQALRELLSRLGSAEIEGEHGNQLLARCLSNQVALLPQPDLSGAPGEAVLDYLLQAVRQANLEQGVVR